MTTASTVVDWHARGDRGVPRRVRVVDIPPAPPLSDLDAPEDVEGSIHGSLNGNGAAARPYRLYSAAELDQLPPAEWVVENAIPQSSLVGVIGAKGQLKTFVVLDLALHVATGTDWQNRRVKQGAVAYIYAEGVFGAKARVDAWCAYHSYLRGAPVDRHALPIWFLPSRLPMNNAAAVTGLLGEIATLPNTTPLLVVVDTLNQNLDGDEDGKGMGGFVAGCARLRDRLGCTVLVVHHTPLGDDGRGRGHTSFDGALDTRLMVSRDADRVTVECTHQRNAADGWSVAFEALPIAGSLALKASALNAGALKGQRREILDVLHRQGTLSYTAWIGATEIKPSSFRKARTWLLANAYVRHEGKNYAATDAGILALEHQGHQEGHRD